MDDGTFTSIIVYGIGVLQGLYLGWVLRERYAQMKINRYLAQAEVQMQEEVADKHIQITIERHNDMFFVYDVNDKKFMAQGETRKQLERNLEERFPGKKFAASHENLKEMGFVHGNADSK